ncbi:hypothetical protein [Actinoallomurus iriomotensis]|uniref:Uncharacterized protein n=1 Tax=Actinoallomurus iriomotensis TaxID=478107 RepID=A0A9W6RXT2_9ACTN|nr:hypothetical protein [Actinoallomurus iriomotensis]GLY81835.1 hypothetical protein Airi01_101020 [Actinoallomurus iriomotensis]
MSNTKKAARRKRLLGRQRPSLPYQLKIEDDTAAVAELAAAKDAVDTARFRDDDRAEQAVVEAEARLETAREAVAACYETIPLTAMEPKAFEALAAQPEHAPREGKDERWNATTFPRAVFLECAPDDLSREEWETFVDERLAQGEREALFLAAVGINARWPSGSIPNV